MKKIFLCWKPFCTRTQNQAANLGAKTIYIYFLQDKRGLIALLFRYTLSFFYTLYILQREKAQIILTLNQPPFLIIAIYIHTLLFGGKYILDSHSAAFNDQKWAWARPLYRFISKRAFLNINTNRYHKSLVEKWGGKSVIISDIPIEHNMAYPLKALPNESIAVAASFMFDEPIEEIWLAAKITPEVHYYITGNYQKLKSNLKENKPHNVHLMGFLTKKEYLGLLRSVAGVMVLTTRNHTMQMGAYEALSLEQPIITSDWPILRESFGESAIYVKNNAKNIASGCRQLLADLEKYKAASKIQKSIRESYYTDAKNEILSLINSSIPYE